MVKKITLGLISLLISLNFISGQELNLKLQPEEPSYFPSNAVNVKKAPSYMEKSELINGVEQNGSIPYKGVECELSSMSFEEGADGKKYGSIEYFSVNLKITQYGAQMKEVFNQMKPYDVAIKQLMDFASSSKIEPDNVGSRKLRNVVTEDVVNGKMVLVQDVITCVESHNKQYTATSFRSVALVGTTIIYITGTYNSESKMVAEKVHGEILEKITKSFH